MLNTRMREVWARGEVAFGSWCAFGNIGVAESIAAVDYDFNCIDTQHGGAGYETSLELLNVIDRGVGTPTVRVPWNEPGIIGKTLDAGANAVIVPMVNTVEQAQAAVSYALYNPRGVRSWGPARADMRQSGYTPETANEANVLIPMIETTEAMRNLDDILAVDGVDAIYVGPADLSITLGLPPGNNDDEPAFTEALEYIVDRCNNAGVVAGIHSTPALSALRVEQGFRMITVGHDSVLLRAALSTALATSRGDAPATGDATPLY
jgi:4-hydroxy-2-oxoheptanedioate aldolase